MSDPRSDEALTRELRRLEAKVVKVSEARFRLPPGSSRARVTTANARHATACEARDRVMFELARRGVRS